MRSQARPADAETRVVRFLGPGEFLVCGDPAVIEKSITFLKDKATRVPVAVAEWAMGMNASRQAEVFELVEGGEE